MNNLTKSQELYSSSQEHWNKFTGRSEELVEKVILPYTVESIAAINIAALAAVACDVIFKGGVPIAPVLAPSNLAVAMATVATIAIGTIMTPIAIATIKPAFNGLMTTCHEVFDGENINKAINDGIEKAKSDYEIISDMSYHLACSVKDGVSSYYCDFFEQGDYSELENNQSEVVGSSDFVA